METRGVNKERFKVLMKRLKTLIVNTGALIFQLETLTNGFLVKLSCLIIVQPLC